MYVLQYTYTHAVCERAKHIAEVEISPFDRVETREKKAPL